MTNHSGDWKDGRWVEDSDPDEEWGNDPTAINTRVMAGGIQNVGLNGKASDTTIYKDGLQLVGKYAEAATTLVDGGIQHVGLTAVQKAPPSATAGKPSSITELTPSITWMWKTALW